MEPFKPIQRTEKLIQAAIMEYLRAREWFVKSTHGNAFQAGFPDLFATHSKFGQRWVEVKRADQFSFTNAQMIDYPKFEANGSKIWIMSDNTDEEYMKLFRTSNLQEYMSCYLDGCRNIIAWRAGRRK